MFYVHGDRHNHFLALYLRGGYLNYVFNLGSGPVKITSLRTYNDGYWHTVSMVIIMLAPTPIP